MPRLITVWRIPLQASDRMLAQLQSLLSDEERRKVSQFKSDIHRRRYIIRHAAMRRILSTEAQCAPEELSFTQARFGKPLLQDPFEGMQFSLSHSADMALLAVCPYGAVGIDLEEQRPLADLHSLVTQVCSAVETRLIVGSTDAQQMFYRCWVGKEAVLKCIGRGLQVSTKGFSVLDAQGDLMYSPALPLECSNASSVALQLLDKLPHGFVGAISILQKAEENPSEIEVRMQDWKP